MRSMAIIVASACVTAAGADCNPLAITQWNFNGASATTVPGGTGSPAPSVGSGAASLFGGTTGAFTSGIVEGGSSDPETTVPPNYGWNITTFAPQGQGDLTRGVEFFASTEGYEKIHVSWDHRNSNTASRWVQFLYTLDGEEYTADGLENGGVFEISAGTTWFLGLTANLGDIRGAADNPNFGFRLLATFGPSGQYEASQGTYGATGTWRLDMVTVTGNPVGECKKGPACLADLNDDDIVDGNDLAILLGGWGGCEACTADLNDDDVVDGNDLAILLGGWGSCE